MLEQAAIAAYLDAETAKLDALVAKVEEAAERLLEYRTALITGAHLPIDGAGTAFRSTVNLTVLSVRASRELAVRLTALPQNRQSADAPLSLPPSPERSMCVTPRSEVTTKVNMRIDHLHLENFKKFASQDIDLHPHFTLLVGENGAGKTTVQIRSNGVRTTNADAKNALEVIKNVYASDAAGQNVVCPVLAYYGAGRAWLPSNERVPTSKANGPARRWAAFYDCFNERIRFAELHKWFSRETTERGNRGGRWRPGFEVVRRAILRCVPDTDDVWFDADRDSIALSIRGNAQPFDNLSAGQRMMLALIADLAIKCVTQNAFLLPPEDLGPEDQPLPRVLQQTPGVVLIDEADVHLHPAWQRRIAADLLGTFPAIQFVCTTHSPQLIGELPRESIRLLSSSGVEIPPVAYGADSNWILEHVMDAEERNATTTKSIHAIEDALEEGDFDSAKARLCDLRGKVGTQEGAVARLEGSIRNLEALANEKG